MRRRILECTVLVGWEDEKMTKPKKCGATTKHVHDTYALAVCPKHMEETQKKGLTLVQHEVTEEDPHGLLVGIGKGSRFIKRQ